MRLPGVSVSEMLRAGRHQNLVIDCIRFLLSVRRTAGISPLWASVFGKQQFRQLQGVPLVRLEFVTYRVTWDRVVVFGIERYWCQKTNPKITKKPTVCRPIGLLNIYIYIYICFITTTLYVCCVILSTLPSCIIWVSISLMAWYKSGANTYVITIMTPATRCRYSQRNRRCFRTVPIH